MSFRKNESHQMTLNDSYFGLTEREKKALEKSWAKVFADDVFPMIDEDRFECLYSSDKASRPNTPVNVIIGALIIKELFNLSDDEVVEDLLLDPRFQYALHTTSFEEQPISDKTLTRFRQRCYDYERLNNVDLYHDCITDLAAKTAKLMKIDGRIRRMDSMMVASNIRRLSRMELLYRCISKLVKYLHDKGHDDLVRTLERYYDPNDFNRTIYHSRSTDAESRIKELLDDAEKLIDRCGGGFDEVTEYQLLVRCLSEQTIVEDGERRLRTKEDGGMSSDMLQSPADPDATFREKAGEQHRGYVGNIEESVGENGSVVTGYGYETNNTGDSAMLRDHLEKIGVQEKETLMAADGAYAGENNVKLAAEKNVKLVTTDLPGSDVPDIVGEFELNETETRVVKCPMGNAPRSSSYIKATGVCTASFDRSCCENCPHKEQCRAKIFKRVARITVTGKKIRRAKLQAEMKKESFKDYARLRNGAETIPSMLRNLFNVDSMPVRGKVKTKFFFGSKIAAVNFRKLFGYRKGLGNYAQNPLISAI